MESSVFICCDLVEWYLGLEDVRVTALHVNLYICVKTNNDPASAFGVYIGFDQRLCPIRLKVGYEIRIFLDKIFLL